MINGIIIKKKKKFKELEKKMREGELVGEDVFQHWARVSESERSGRRRERKRGREKRGREERREAEELSPRRAHAARGARWKRRIRSAAPAASFFGAWRRKREGGRTRVAKR